MNKKNILIFVIVFLLLNFIISMCSKQGANTAPLTTGDFAVATTKTDYEQDQLVGVKIKNNTKEDYVIKDKCPSEPLEVQRLENGQWTVMTYKAEIKCGQATDTVISPDQEITINFTSWNHALFGSMGQYKITAVLTPKNPQSTSQPVTVDSNTFEIKEKGIIGVIWTVALYQPIYNVLIFLIKYIPFHDLGFAIILLTFIIRTILLIPSQKGLKSQRKLQELQPKLNKLKEKYKDNQEMLAKETMELWKEHKVNPFGSCLPLVIQFPVLIALFYVIQSGLNPNNAYLLYGPLRDFTFSSINVIFLGILDLTKINSIVLPIFVGSLQFLQMKLALMKTEKKKEELKDPNKKETKNEMETANQMMIYVMPVMIAVFTASVPAGVGLYWSVSTSYGIIQQIVVNKQVKTETATVRVIK